MRAVRALFVFVLLLWPVLGAASPPGAVIPFFPNERQAQQHCPTDVVVWLNTQSRVYHFKGQRYYANTRVGAFACMHEADKAGYRSTRNGQ